jgi:hypothetical protein
MAYTIVKSDGTTLTTIADGTINTTSTSLGLPGRNYAGYGQSLDTNFVHMVENFADSTPPSNPLAGQLWFNTSSSTLLVCPTDGETNALAWLTLAQSGSGGTTTFGTVNVTGNLTANNIAATNEVSANLVTTNYLTVTANATIANAVVTSGNIGTLTTTAITTGAANTNGTLTGIWTVSGNNTGSGASAMIFNTGGIAISNSAGANLYGIKCDKYMYANGTPISFAGTYSNANVASYLPTYNGNILTVQTQATVITTGANATAGTLTGNWTLTTGSRLNATYADLAERQHADRAYPIGTVIKVGGLMEVTSAGPDDCNDVLGVVSNTAAYLMNAEAGNDATHPPIALVGRVNIRVVGPIRKGDKVTATFDGCAVATADARGFGWALESSEEEAEKLVLCVIK